MLRLRDGPAHLPTRASAHHAAPNPGARVLRARGGVAGERRRERLGRGPGGDVHRPAVRELPLLRSGPDEPV